MIFYRVTNWVFAIYCPIQALLFWHWGMLGFAAVEAVLCLVFIVLIVLEPRQ